MSIHIAAMLPIALLIPWSILLQRWLYGVRTASLTSILNVFRTAVFGKAILVALPLWAINLVVSTLVMGSTTTTWSTVGLASVFLVTFPLTPLQAAGEECEFRGLVFRVAASWAKGPRVALLLGISVSSVLFAVVHFSTDPWGMDDDSGNAQRVDPERGGRASPLPHELLASVEAFAPSPGTHRRDGLPRDGEAAPDRRHRHPRMDRTRNLDRSRSPSPVRKSCPPRGPRRIARLTLED